MKSFRALELSVEFYELSEKAGDTVILQKIDHLGASLYKLMQADLKTIRDSVYS